MNFFRNENFKQKLFEKIGFGDDLQKDDPLAKLTFKHSVVNQKERDYVNHHLSIHSRCLQRSNYLMIDDDINQIQQTFHI